MTSTSTSTDVLIIGGGPAGATAALRLLDMGIQSVIVEREQFPRFHVGESMSGEAGSIVRELGFEDQMASDAHPIKHGVNVYGPQGPRQWFVPVARRNAEGDLEDQVTWQVRRSTFDKMILDEAKRRGVEVISGKATSPLLAEDGRTVVGARIETDTGTHVDIAATVTLDCSGMANFLANKKVTGKKYVGSYDKQIAIFSHIENFVRDGGDDRELEPGNTHIFYAAKYRWAWAIPIDDQVTSVGIVIPAEYYRSKKESQQEFLRRELHELQPGLGERVDGDPQFAEEARVIRNYSFQIRRFAGPGYICVGDSHRFVDPIFSFGLFVALREAGLAADATAQYLAGKGRDDANPFHDYMVEVERGIDMLEDLVDVFWENPLAFSVMAHRRYRPGITDLFSGRVFNSEVPLEDRDKAIRAIRKLLKRDRSYEDVNGECVYSIPVGSRYDEERAALWNSHLDSVESAEAWMETVA